jgi:hypothetical protein
VSPRARPDSTPADAAHAAAGPLDGDGALVGDAFVGETAILAKRADAPYHGGRSGNEVTPALDPRDFTLRTIDARLARAGDLWARLRAARRFELETVAPGLPGSSRLKPPA